VFALVAAVLAPAAYAVDAVAKPHTGSSPIAGPTLPRRGGFPGFSRQGGFPPQPGTDLLGGSQAGGSQGGGSQAGGSQAGGSQAGGSLAGGSQGGGSQAGGSRAGGSQGGGFPGGGFGGGGGRVDAALVTLLKGTTSTWAAATVSAMSGAPIQLAVGRPIMMIGGFSGGDPAPTLAHFQQYVRAGRVRYFIARPGRGSGSRGRGFMAQNGTSAQITAWVQKTFVATQVGNQTVYDLTDPQ
jgi:hypothetical protein